jgi:hypothetical protein
MAMTDLNRVTSMLNSIITGATWPVVPAGWHLRLMSSNGSGSSNGTELTTANGYTALGSAYTAPSTISGTTAAISPPGTGGVSWTASGAGFTVAGIEIWDTAGTPLRWIYGALTGGSVTVNAGNTLQFAAGSITLTATGW